MSSSVGFGRAHQNRVVRMSLDMLLQVLRSLEGFTTKVAFVRLERNVYADVGGDVIALDRRRAAVAPLASEIQVVGALSTNVSFADMVLSLFD